MFVHFFPSLFLFLFFGFGCSHRKKNTLTEHVLDTNKVWRTMKKRWLASTKLKRNNKSNKRMVWVDCRRCWRWSRRPAMFGIKCRLNSNKSNQQSPINRMIVGQQTMSIATTKAVSRVRSSRLTFCLHLVSSRVRVPQHTNYFATKAIDEKKKRIKALWLLGPFQAEIYCRTIKIHCARLFLVLLIFCSIDCAMFFWLTQCWFYFFFQTYVRRMSLRVEGISKVIH